MYLEHLVANCGAIAGLLYYRPELYISQTCDLELQNQATRQYDTVITQNFGVFGGSQPFCQSFIHQSSLS